VKRLRRTQILVEGRATCRQELVVRIREACNPQLVQPAQTGLVLLDVRDSAQGQRFHPGEATVQEARVRIGDSIGLGFILGHDAQAAEELATVDAAFKANLACVPSLIERLEAEAGWLEAQRAEQAAQRDATRVRFDTMEVETE